jgi:hypothetical protein
MTWTPATTKPASSQIVLAAYRNDQGNPRIVRAVWVAANTVESLTDDEGVGVYCEANDTYYLAEGWWEQIDNWDDYGQVLIHHEFTHWMPMPEGPQP